MSNQLFEDILPFAHTINNIVTFSYYRVEFINYICINVANKATNGLKKNKCHIINSWILLLCFAAGQYMVYSHQHKPVRAAKYTCSASKHQPGQIVTDKCQLCDAMHHNGMNLSSEVTYQPVAVTNCVYKSSVYNFTSLALILSGGRAPPSASHSV